MTNERKLTKSELDKREDIVKSMKNNKRDLVKKYGKDAEKVMYGRATNIAKKQNENMETKKPDIRKMVEDALKNPKKADLNKDGKLSDYEKKRGAAIEKNLKENDFGGIGLIVRGKTSKDNDLIDQAVEESGFYGVYNPQEDYWFFPEETGETMDELEFALEKIFMKKGVDVSYEGQFYESISEDLDLGHQDDEPGMLKGDLYKIGKYAMELYQMMDSLEEKGEIDFPHWWQSKIITAKNMISGAKHYLDFEMKEPQIDAMVGLNEEAINSDYKYIYKKIVQKYPDVVGNWDLIKSFVDDEISNIEITDTQDMLNKFNEYRRKKFKGVVGKMVGMDLNESSLIYYLVSNRDTGKTEVRAGSKTTNKSITGTYRFKTREEAEAKAKELNLKSTNEGMSEEEWAKAKEEDRLAKLPMDQQAKIKKAIAMLKAEKKPKK